MKNFTNIFTVLMTIATYAQSVDFEKHTLENGLDVILHQDNSAPVVVTSIMYHVGAKDEDEDKTGFAHFFEHLLFEGTKNIDGGYGGWNQIINSNGGTFNANTTYSSNGNYNRDYGLNLAQRMDQKATSNVTYSKRWIKSKNSISINLYSNQDLLVGKKVDSSSNYYVNPTHSGSQLNISNKTLPKISFRHGQSSLFPTLANKNRWYSNIKWNYGFNYTKKEREYYQSNYSDALGSYDWERDENGNPIDTLFQDAGWTHTSSLNAPIKLFKHINVNLNLQAQLVCLISQ